ncbi:DUF3325 domain-containing protein [Alteromonas sp. 1_MG-2023]|uniref:DUF3325 domain-containing protein n=1 Tax=Alteromonas sp. 1_MG-2023 TaxID=3062669 RepID=UPI0026E21FBB|nr:DUF3325 domain-containing protein [Alteromonas sp. 1_MG-2023]MDO6566095.1 DUF3325 domain-containing protein [Alteromonas sp. 1_MG-2023]
MVTVFILVILGIALLALASDKHFKQVASIFNRKRRAFVHTATRVSGWLLTGGSLIAAVYAPLPLSISLVWWFTLISCAIFLVALIINKSN